MGCEFAGIFLMPSGEVCHLGSTAGQHFLNNNPDVDLKFRDHFACPKTSKYREEDVTRLFQKKYSELVGHPCAQVPWKRDNLCAQGMPEGIPLKKACFYGSKQIQAIMREAKNICLRFKESSISTGNEPECGSPDLSPDQLPYESPPSPVRTDEALTSVHSTVVGGLILPVYTASEDEKFWLFYTEDYSPSKIAALKSQKSRARIWGRWFDLDPSNDSYTLQQARSYITTKNIIESEAGCMYHQQDLTHNQVYKLPNALRAAIFSILASQGYLD